MQSSSKVLCRHTLHSTERACFQGCEGQGPRSPTAQRTFQSFFSPARYGPKTVMFGASALPELCMLVWNGFYSALCSARFLRGSSVKNCWCTYDVLKVCKCWRWPWASGSCTLRTRMNPKQTKLIGHVSHLWDSMPIPRKTQDFFAALVAGLRPCTRSTFRSSSAERRGGRQMHLCF